MHSDKEDGHEQTLDKGELASGDGSDLKSKNADLEEKIESTLDEIAGIKESDQPEFEDEQDDPIRNEYEKLHDRYLRLAADFENYKKRLAKEKADVIAYGNEELIKALLNVLDNLERAIEHGESSDQADPLLEGVKLVHKQFLSCIERFGVKPVEAERMQEFDPSYHQAIERVETADVTPGLILSESLKGYTLKDRLLRPSLVVVSKEPKEHAQMESSSSSDHERVLPQEDSAEIIDLTNEAIDES